MASKAVVLLSGGLDSATTLAIAQRDGHQCCALSVFYGQRHRAELNAAARIVKAYGVQEHLQIDIALDRIGGSALTDSALAVPEQMEPGIPVTYVPARNTVFLSLALGWAEVLHAGAIYIGVNAVDYSGYPDCRPVFIQAFQQLAAVATKGATQDGAVVQIRTPLLTLSKAQIIQKGLELGVDYSLTVSCYQADDEGRACGKCNACEIRRDGFASLGIVDPTRYR